MDPDQLCRSKSLKKLLHRLLFALGLIATVCGMVQTSSATTNSAESRFWIDQSKEVGSLK